MKNNKILYLVNDSSFFISHRLPTAVAAISEGYEVHIASRMHNNKKYLEGKGFFCHEINFSRSPINFLIELQLIFKSCRRKSTLSHRQTAYNCRATPQLHLHRLEILARINLKLAAT